MTKILIGSNNEAKINTYKKLLNGMGLEVVSAKDLNIMEPEENAKSFEEEAVRKARYYFEQSGIPAIADDGGFEIEALGGEPGIRSRRWIGREMTDEEIISEVIKRMGDQQNRKAKHVVYVSVATPFGVFAAHSEIAGIVPMLASPKRINKYPYRSVLFLPNYNKYWGDLTDEEEQILNHRAHAVEKLQDVIRELNK